MPIEAPPEPHAAPCTSNQRLKRSGCCRWSSAPELTVSDRLQSLGHAGGLAASGGYQGTADAADDHGGGGTRTPVCRRRTLASSGRTTAPLRLDGSLPTPMHMVRLCTGASRLPAPGPAAMRHSARRDLRIVTAFAGTAAASPAPCSGPSWCPALPAVRVPSPSLPGRPQHIGASLSCSRVQATARSR